MYTHKKLDNTTLNVYSIAVVTAGRLEPSQQEFIRSGFYEQDYRY